MKKVYSPINYGTRASMSKRSNTPGGRYNPNSHSGINGGGYRRPNYYNRRPSDNQQRRGNPGYRTPPPGPGHRSRRNMTPGGGGRPRPAPYTRAYTPSQIRPQPVYTRGAIGHTAAGGEFRNIGSEMTPKPPLPAQINTKLSPSVVQGPAQMILPEDIPLSFSNETGFNVFDNPCWQAVNQTNSNQSSHLLNNKKRTEYKFKNRNAHGRYTASNLPKNKFTFGQNQQALTNPYPEWSQKEDTNLDANQTTPSQIDILQKCLEINITHGFDPIKALNSRQTPPLLINIKEVNFDHIGTQLEFKVDLVCVIDVSGSMPGQKLENVKDTMKRMLRFLKLGHRLAIILFSDQAQTYMNFKLVNNTNIGRIIGSIEAISSTKGTNIAAGVHEAQKLLGKRRDDSNPGFVLLLSDGRHNEGPINVDMLYRDDLMRTKCQYTLTSFGYGEDHSAQLMQDMAEEKGGDYHFINEIEKVEGYFSESWAKVTRILGQNMRVSVMVKAKSQIGTVKFLRVYGPCWNAMNHDYETNLEIGSFYPGFDKNFLCLLNITQIFYERPQNYPRDAQPLVIEVEIGEVELLIDTPDRHPTTLAFRKPMMLKVLPANSTRPVSMSQQVDEHLMKEWGAEALQEAEKYIEREQYKKAILVLDAFEGELASRNFKGKKLFACLKKQVEERRRVADGKNQGVNNTYQNLDYTKKGKGRYVKEEVVPFWGNGVPQNTQMAGMRSKY